MNPKPIKAQEVAKKTTKELTYNDVADFFLAFANETGETITNLKLQKLVYYAQAWYLANYHQPLFDADFEAWVHGPVIPDLYCKYKYFGFSPIKNKIKLEDVEKNMDKKIMDFLSKVATVYMPSGAYELELMTHNENPWIEARGECDPDESCNNTIDKSNIEVYYGEKISTNKTNQT